MDEDRIRSILIVGAGANAWLAAAILARRLSPNFCTVRVLEVPPRRPDPIAVAGLPSFGRLITLLGIEEADLLRAAHGTFSLGAEFQDWHRLGDTYFHGFGSVGARLEAVGFHHHWARLRALGDTTPLEEYSTAAVAARAGRFARPATDPRSVLSLYSYGYHLDAGSLSAFLRRHAESRGVQAIAGEVVGAPRCELADSIQHLQLADGRRVQADLFVDCGADIDAESGWVDWGRWLPCDRAVAARRVTASADPPRSEVRAAPGGWYWRRPLQNCVDVGYAFSSRHCDADEAVATLKADLPGLADGDVGYVSFRPGRPESSWRGNCISLATNALAPLEATALHLTQTGVARLLSLFPVKRFSPPDVAEFNRLTALEHDRIRDLMVLHYVATERDDSPFWRDCRLTELPETLAIKLDLFRRCGRIGMLEEEHFSEDSWLAVLIGQRVYPDSYDPLADVLPVSETRTALQKMRTAIRAAVMTLPLFTDAAAT